MAKWESVYAQRENEANVFAATLLMPFDDFRAQVGSSRSPDIRRASTLRTPLRCFLDRRDASLAAVCTSRRSILVVSREGFILWARSSKRALRSGLFYKTRNMPPIEIPQKALAATAHKLNGPVGTCEFADDVWLDQPCTEHVFVSGQYDFALSLLHFADGT